MPMGDITESIQDGGLGIQPPSNAQLRVIAGVCTGGTANTVYAFTDQASLVSTLTGGPAVECAAYELGVAGGTILVCPINASVQGVASAVSATRVAASNGTVTVSSGTPLDAFSVRIKVVSAGTGQLVTGGNVAVQVSVDGGSTYGAITLVPASGAFTLRDPKSTATGLVLAFSVSTSTFDYGDTFAIACQAPFYSATDVNNMYTGLLADLNEPAWVHIVGYPTAGVSSVNAAASATIASTVSTNMTLAQTNGQYLFTVMEAPPSTDADISSAFVNFTDRRVKVEAGTDVITSPISGSKFTRSQAWALSARLAAIRPSVSPGQTGSGLQPNSPGGPLQGVVSINRDERTATTKLFDQGFGVVTTYRRLPGFYCDTGRMKAPPGSDFTYVMNRRVMDQACSNSRRALYKYLNCAIRVNSTTGLILDQDALAVEQYVEQYIRAAMGTEFSDISIDVLRNNILTSNQLQVRVNVTPFGYATSISETIGFVNPALALV